MPDGQGEGLLDLEKELTCPICTDVLYQPLTVLDCLHTCCGSCLREWFAWQASKATTSSPYTCPSCRAAVRGTRPNATVTTLLEHLIRVHPEKSKSQEDKDEIAKTYKPGDNVTPPVDVETESEDSDDERELEQARYLSLRDVDPERTRRRAERSAHNTRARRRHEEAIRTAAHPPADLARVQQPSRTTAQRRQVEHQSSLRSLLSASDIDDEDIREDIMRQIAHDGLLDGVDLSNMTPAQEEEVIERIAQALQRRQGQNSSRSSSTRRTDQSPRPASGHRRHGDRPRSRSAQRNAERSHHDRPPLSRPHLLGVAAENDRRQRNRSSSGGSHRSQRSTATNDTPPRSTTQAASRSTTDLSSTSGSDTRERRRRASHSSRTNTDPEGQTLQVRTRRERASSREHSALSTTPLTADPPRRSQSPQRSLDQSSPRMAPTSSPAQGNEAALNPPPTRHLRHTSASDPTSSQTEVSTTAHHRPPRSSTILAPPRPPPAISCSRCQKHDIQFSLHYNCTKCDSGAFNICLSCYRAGRGCRYWFGFGYAASIRFHRSEWPANAELPHVLTARRYKDSRNGSSQLENGHSQDPAIPSNLETGLFCDSCFSNSNACYWHCETCLDGAWGYCQTCASRGHHCTHPLEAMALKSLLCLDTESPHPPSPPAATPPAETSANFSHISTTIKLSTTTSPSPGPISAMNEIVRIPSLLRLRTKYLPHIPNPEAYAPLLLPCECDICHRPIPSSAPRYHCFTCSEGDYDICSSCYNSLSSTGKITHADGPKGWRRCLKGHRMVVIGFEERERGLRRVILRDLVGGWALKDEHNPAKAAANARDAADKAREAWRWRESDGREGSVPFAHATEGVINVQTSPLLASTAVPAQGLGLTALPPDGGVGLRVQALWSYFPAEGVEDELAFPKNAEVREAEDINGDWFWGVYAGRRGLFPGNYGRVVGY
ncbi:hypothetical protein BDZ85DRAFT_299510 [Elsinoe ampelina]|uniref:RING-type domain-containing protein n=1 Tax=Elsinoe ampelina TaxID=302913 RepID=A0A6A6FYK3_9PEZI|nr:hypothetical protein BDZ85DRAFT_299510 [Elsinoe ampelina]